MCVIKPQSHWGHYRPFATLKHPFAAICPITFKTPFLEVLCLTFAVKGHCRQSDSMVRSSGDNLRKSQLILVK